MFAVKDGEVKEITKYREPQGASNGVMWCPHCDYSSMDGQNITRCAGCGADFREGFEASLLGVEPPDAPTSFEYLPEGEGEGKPEYRGVVVPEPPEASWDAKDLVDATVSETMCNLCGGTFKSPAGVRAHQRRKHKE